MQARRCKLVMSHVAGLLFQRSHQQSHIRRIDYCYERFCHNKIVTINDENDELTSNEKKIFQAHLDLQKAIRELSDDMTIPVMKLPLVPPRMIEYLLTKPITSLTIDELTILGTAHSEGKQKYGEVDNFAKAMDCWKLAQEKGSKFAAFSVASFLRQGFGTKKDQQRASSLFIDLCEKHNYTMAHYSLATMLSTGEGIEKDAQKAFHHFNEAAKRGFLLALRNIAMAYEEGIGVDQSYENAIKYYEKSVATGDPVSKFMLGALYYKGKVVKQDKVRSFKLQYEAAEAGVPAAMCNIGFLFLHGDGVIQDYTRAKFWLEKAVESEFADGAMHLATMYRYGLGGERSLQKATDILSRFTSQHEGCRNLYDEIKKQKMTKKKSSRH